MDERTFVTKDETSGKTLTSNSRTARLLLQSFHFQSMVQNHSYFRAEGNQSKERKSEKVASKGARRSARPPGEELTDRNNKDEQRKERRLHPISGNRPAKVG